MTQIMGETLSLWMKDKTQQDYNMLGKKLCTFLYSLMNKYDLIYCDPHWSNFLIDENNCLGIVDFGSIVEVPRAYRSHRYKFHRSCVNKDYEEFVESAGGMELFDKNCNEEGKKYLYDFFCCNLTPFMTDNFKFEPLFMSKCKQIPFETLNYINVRSHVYPFVKMSYNLNNLLCRLKCEGNFKEIMEISQERMAN